MPETKSEADAVAVTETETETETEEKVFEEAPQEKTFVPKSDGENFQDVAEFGNTEIPAGGSGALFYDIEISGIDTPELRKELLEIFEDKRLNLQASAMIPKIKGGILKLSQIHPVRAAVLVGRLKATHLKVKWTTEQMIKSLSILVILFFVSMALGNEWNLHEVNLKDYSMKINNLQDDIHDLAMKKKAELDPKKREEILVEIKKKYAELKTSHRELLKEIEHVRFEHPEKGEKTERKYRHIKVKTLEQLENDTSMDGQLNKIKRKAEEKYQRP